MISEKWPLELIAKHLMFIPFKTDPMSKSFPKILEITSRVLQLINKVCITLPLEVIICMFSISAHQSVRIVPSPTTAHPVLKDTF